MKKKRCNYLYFANMLASCITACFPILLCCIALASATSCSDESKDYDPENVDDPEQLADPLPTNDQLSVTHNNTLYFLSAWSQEDRAISDNMVNRYKDAVPYAPGTKMEVGDAFFFTKEDIARFQSDAELLADIKDMFHKRSIVMMMEGGTNEDFNTVCTLLDCYNPYPKDDESHPDELSLWVFSGPLPSANGFYSKIGALSTAIGTEGTKSEEPVQVIDEYGQGVHCDMTSQSLQSALEPKAPSNGSSNLKDLASPYIITSQVGYDAPTYRGHGGKGKNDIFQVEAKIWTAHSDDHDKHYYLVNLGFIAYVEPSFYGEWHSNLWKAYGLCLTNVYLTFAPINPNGATLLAHSPQTTENQSFYTSNVSFRLEGNVSVNGSQIQDGVTISNSHTETINDIGVINMCDPGTWSPQLRWQFDLREPSSHFHLLRYMCSAVDAGAKKGISICSLSTDFIISLPDGFPNEWMVFMRSILKGYLFNDMYGRHDQQVDTYEATVWRPINLPMSN